MILSFFLGMCLGAVTTIILILVLALFWSKSTITENIKEIAEYQTTKQEPIKRGL